MSDPTPEHDPETLPPGAEMLTGHNYDGIQEYDNPTPAWWTWIFIGSVIFGIIYLFFVLAAGDELSPIGQYRRASVANLELQYGELGDVQPDAATLIDLQTRDGGKWMSAAQSIYQVQCKRCHGGNAEGLTGPNLTDDAYLHVQSIEDIATVIREGANNGAMPPHEAILEPVEIVLISSYVALLRGTNAPGLPPDGEVPPEWTEE